MLKTFVLFQIFQKYEDEFKSYVELHDMHEVLSDLMRKCFERNEKNPKEFICRYLSRDDGPLDRSVAEEIYDLKLGMQRLNDKHSKLKFEVARLKKKLEDDQKRARELQLSRSKTLKICENKKKCQKKLSYSSDDKRCSSKRSTKKKTRKRNIEKKTIPVSPYSEGGSFIDLTILDDIALDTPTFSYASSPSTDDERAK